MKWFFNHPVTQVLLVAVAYFALGQLTAMLRPDDRVVWLFWPPAGLALAVVLRGGIRLLPGIALGSFCHSLTAHSLPVAVGVATGNTLQAFVGAALLGPSTFFDRSLGRLSDVFKLAVLGAVTTALVGPTIGASALCLLEGMPWELFPISWLGWWINNALSNLVVAPFLLTWTILPPLNYRRALLATSVLAFLVLTSAVVLSQSSPVEGGSYPLTFLLFPFLIGIALAFGRRGSTAAILVVGIVAFIVTRYQSNRLSHEAFLHWLLLLQAFIGVMAVTTLALATAIHERRQTEVVLRRSEEQFRQVWEHSVDGMAVIDADGYILEVNPAYCRMFGKSPRQLVGRPFVVVIADSEQENWLKRFREGARTGDLHAYREEEVALWDGRTLWLEHSNSLFPGSNALPRVLTVLRDVTERKYTEEALRVSEARYRSLVEDLEQGVFLKDAQLRYIAANVPFCRGLGLSPEEIVGRSDHDLYSPEQADRYTESDRQVLTENRRLEAEETVAVGPHSRVVRVIKTPVRDTNGRPVGVLGILWDVTEQRRLETQLREAQQLEAVGQLAGGIAHDFNNLLTAILGNVGLVLANRQMEGAERAILSSVEQAGRRAADLTQQLLGFARRAVLRPEPLNLNTIVDETTGLIGRTLHARIKLEVQKAPDLWPVLADPGQMNQVLLNLCLNARDAMPQGGQLTIETANTVVDEAQAQQTLDAQPGDYVRLRVTDTGVGIPVELRSRIFEPFFTTKPPGQGNGLGLAMVFGILKQHRGWAQCESEVGQGSRFDVYLPRGEEAAPPPGPAPKAREGPATILVVDDEDFIRKLARDVLERQGYRVLVASDGTQALTVYGEQVSAVDLVVLDLTMPGLSGQDTFRELRRLRPEVRVVLSSGYTAEDLTEAPGVVFLSKPYSPKQLTAKVREALNKAPAV